MRAGKVRQRITFQRRATTRDAAGGQVNTWSDVSGLTNIPAEEVVLSGNERVLAAAPQSEVSVVWRLRYVDGIDATLRIVHVGRNRTRYFNITAVRMTKLYRELELDCKEGAALG